MKLCVDVGNTTIGLGFYQDDKLINKLVLTTSIEQSQDEYHANIHLLMNDKNINPRLVTHIIYSSVVPLVNELLLDVLKSLFNNAEIVILDASSPHHLKMNIDNPKELGSDLIADLVGAKAKYSLPLVVIDFGTATKLLLIDQEGYFSSALIPASITSGCEVSPR